MIFCSWLKSQEVIHGFDLFDTALQREQGNRIKTFTLLDKSTTEQTVLHR